MIVLKVCGLLLPNESQGPYFAVRALNAELASVKDGSSLTRGTKQLAQQQQQQRQGDDATSATSTTTTLAPSSIALQMRMQWWRDAIGTVYGDGDVDDGGGGGGGGRVARSPLAQSLSISCWRSPVVRALHRAAKVGGGTSTRSSSRDGNDNDDGDLGLTRRFLERLVDAREDDLDVVQYATLEDSVRYAESTASSLLYLSLECLGVRSDDADAVASHAGVGIGLATLLRGTPFRLLRGEIPVPKDLFPDDFPFDHLTRSVAEHAAAADRNDDDGGGGDPLSMLTPGQVDAWRSAVREVAREASGHLSQAREWQSRVPKAGRPALLPVVPTLHYLSRLQEVAEFDVFDPRLYHPASSARLSMLLKLGRARVFGIF